MTHAHLCSMGVIPRILREQLAGRNPRDNDGDPLPKRLGLDGCMMDPQKK